MLGVPDAAFKAYIDEHSRLKLWQACHVCGMHCIPIKAARALHNAPMRMKLRPVSPKNRLPVFVAEKPHSKPISA